MWDLSSPTKDRTRVSCVVRWILNHWTTREVPLLFLNSKYSFPNRPHWRAVSLGISSKNVDLGRSEQKRPTSLRQLSADICPSPAGGAVTHLHRVGEHGWTLAAHLLTSTFHFQTSEIVRRKRNTVEATYVILSFLAVILLNVNKKWVN